MFAIELTYVVRVAGIDHTWRVSESKLNFFLSVLSFNCLKDFTVELEDKSEFERKYKPPNVST